MFRRSYYLTALATGLAAGLARVAGFGLPQPPSGHATPNQPVAHVRHTRRDHGKPARRRRRAAALRRW